MNAERCTNSLLIFWFLKIMHSCSPFLQTKRKYTLMEVKRMLCLLLIWKTIPFLKGNALISRNVYMLQIYGLKHCLNWKKTIN